MQLHPLKAAQSLSWTPEVAVSNWWDPVRLRRNCLLGHRPVHRVGKNRPSRYLGTSYGGCSESYRRLSRSVREEAWCIFSDKPLQQNFIHSFTCAEAAEYLQLEPTAPTRKRRCFRKADCRQVARQYLAGGTWVCRSWHSYWSVRDSLQQGHLLPQHRRQVHLPSWHQARLAWSSNGRRPGMGHAKCSFTCLISSSTTHRPGNFHGVVSTYYHIYAKKRGITKKPILTIRAVMIAEQIDVVAGDFNGTAWRCSNRDNISTIDEAFVDYALPAPPGPTPLWGPGSIPNNWADVCGFLKPPGSDRYWKVRMHGAFSIPRKVLGLRPKDQSCHHETWLHLDFVDWRNTRSQHGEHDRRILLKERPAPPHLGAQKRRISDIRSDHSLSSWTCNHLHVHVSFYMVRTSSRSDLMSSAAYDRHATGEACFGFILSFSCFIFVCFEHSPCATPITNIMSWRKKKTSVQLHIDQVMRNRNFRVRSEVVERGAVTKSQNGKKACVGRKVGERFQWKTHGLCFKGDPCSFSHDKIASGNRVKGQRPKGRSSSPAPNSKAKTDGKEQRWRFWHEKSDSMPIQDFFKKKKNPHVNFGIFPYVRITGLKKDAKMATNVIFDMLKQRKSPAKSQRKVVQKDPLLYWRSLHKWVVHLKVLIRENLSHVNQECSLSFVGEYLMNNITERGYSFSATAQREIARDVKEKRTALTRFRHFLFFKRTRKTWRKRTSNQIS